jgi:uncharacterized membrane protein YczE
MSAQKTIPIAFTTSGADLGSAPFAVTARRLFGLDGGDWSIVFLGIALAGSLLALI